MKRLSLIWILIASLSINLFGQRCDSCKIEFDKLLIIKEKSVISQADLEISWQITQKLYKLQYVDYIDTINGAEYLIHSLTRTFSDICIKAGGQSGVDYYFNYLDFTSGSSEEERSFALERLFVKYPEIVLNKIGEDYSYLDHLVWGFVNNRFYGAVNPYEEDDYTAITFHVNGPKPVLNKGNCRAIFFETNPVMKEKYDGYKNQIDYIINEAIALLKEKE